MDRFRQKPKKEKSVKHVDKEKPQSFIADVKSFKEHLKIKEILRTVKMNNSMRVKAPRGSKIMHNKDFNDNDDLFDEETSSEPQDLPDPLSAINPDVIVANDDCLYQGSKEHCAEDFQQSKTSSSYETSTDNIDTSINKSKQNVSNSQLECSTDTTGISHDSRLNSIIPENKVTNEDINIKCRDRKLSLDHTILTRREGWSQSEFDLHSIGKLPLERKSSFFRKKMDSFFKNTTEIFKRQSMSKPQPIQRRGSMTGSLQSLNSPNYGSMAQNNQELLRDSVGSLHSTASTTGRSTPSLPGPTAGADAASCSNSLAGSQPTLYTSQPLVDFSSDSVHSLNEGYIQDSLLNSRAISMSSGLDSAHGQRRRKTSRSNRVTWVGSEGLANYFRRVIQDEKREDKQVYQSYSDFSSIPENELSGPKVDSKGRRLSYQRAVSGEDPVSVTRYQDSSLRRRSHIPENSEASYELSNQLAEFTRNGVPTLKGFCVAAIPDEAFAYLLWAERGQNIEEFYDWKNLHPKEEARQAVIRELVSTEADHIRHLIAIVEVFIAAAHALQDAGKLLDIDTEKLFSNIPDVLNASLYFWNMTFYPMLADAVEKNIPFNTEWMSPGFCRFRESFQPYEKYVNEQTKALDYLRSLSSNSEFMMYLTWCHSHKSCKRLQLSDIMVKPMQRLTKYSLILRRIIAHTETEPEKTSLMAMESFAKNYVLDLNRSIRQREELEKLDVLASSVDAYEMDFKDEDMDRYFRMYSALNLRAQMINCLPSHSRSLIHQGDLRFKDNLKDMEVRVFLLTDMLLVCKKLSKGSSYPYKLVRPKYMVDRMVPFPKLNPRSNKESASLIFVMVDDVGSSCHCFTLSEYSKDSNSITTLKLWEQKIREAKLTYDLGVWFARNPSRDLSEVEMDSSSDYALSGTSTGKPGGIKQSSDDLNIEREARERVAAMLHRSLGASTEHDYSQASMTTESFDGEASATSAGGRTGGLYSLRHPMHRTSTGGSSRNSRLSSFQQSTSAASHDEPQAGPSRCDYRAGSSVEHLIPPLNPDDTVTSITVNVVSESESETVVPTPPHQPPPLMLSSRSSSPGQHTLRVQPQSGVMALVHSLPDLTLDPTPHLRLAQSPSPQSASEKLYQSHQELLHRNRLSAVQHHQYLTPDHRGSSYPPPSPTRASLKRGLAFSYSFKNPPLSKMGHVNSQTQMQAEAGPSTSQAKGSSTTQTKGSSMSQNKDEKGTLTSISGPSTSSDKSDKKSKHVSSRHKGGTSSPNRKEDKGD